MASKPHDEQCGIIQESVEETGYGGPDEMVVGNVKIPSIQVAEDEDFSLQVSVEETGYGEPSEMV